LPEQIEHQDTQTAQISGTVQIKQNGDRQNADATKPDEEEVPQKSGRKFIVIAVIILLVIGASIFYWRSTFTEDTDDAQVDGDLYQVSSRVTGQVIKVYVDDNQQVNVGAPIAEIDPKDYQVAVEQAQANLASAQAAAIQATVNVPITSVNVHTSVDTTSSDVQGATAAVEQARRQLRDGLPLRAELFAESSGSVKGLNSAKIVAEMRNISTDVDSSQFTVPEGLTKIPPEQIRAQIDAVASTAAAVIRTLLTNLNSSAPSASPSPTASPSASKNQ